MPSTTLAHFINLLKGEILIMKIVRKISTLTMAGVIALFGFSTVIGAEEVSRGESEVKIEFIPGEDTPKVVDPTDPEQPYEPDPEDETDPQDPPTGETGPLTLDYVSSVNFGENKIVSNTQIYESSTLRPFIQVTDRRGSGEGWEVTAAASGFEVVEGEETKETLLGSIITFTNGEVVSTSTSEVPIPAQEVELATDGDAARVVTASVDTGLGSWVNRWFPSEDADANDNVTLEVPAGAATTGSHTATIAWTLTDAPGQ